jgi:RNA polymerase sigma-70 factor (ECF subfamily)
MSTVCQSALCGNARECGNLRWLPVFLIKNWPNPVVYSIVQTLSPTNETELLARCRAGNAEAWDALFDLHYAPASRFVFQLASDFTREDVEEVCQEVFLTVIKSLHTFQGNSQFQTWLFRIAANKARDYRQRQYAAKRGGGQTLVPLDTAPNDDSENGYTIDPPSAQAGPDLALMNAERLAVVGEALEQLGGPCQEIIELRYFADLSYEEIAASLELNPKTVSSRLSKCLDKLEGITRALLARQEAAVTSQETSREKKTATSV